MMKTFLLISLTLLSAMILAGARNKTPMTAALQQNVPASFYELEIRSLTDEPLDLSAFKGKFVLCVNVASKCGFTPQYESLQSLYDQYQDKLVIIGFPCNQFLGQEPGTPEDIASFCQKNYGVTFPMTEKIDVKGKEQHPVYAWLTQKQYNQVADADVSWNFNKFLVSPDGEWLAHFPSKTDPLSEEIVHYLK